MNEPENFFVKFFNVENAINDAEFSMNSAYLLQKFKVYEKEKHFVVFILLVV